MHQSHDQLEAIAKTQSSFFRATKSPEPRPVEQLDDNAYDYPIDDAIIENRDEAGEGESDEEHDETYIKKPQDPDVASKIEEL